MKLPYIGFLSLGARLTLAGTAETRGTAYHLLPGGAGAVIASDVEPHDAPAASDFVAVAERFVGTPYLWGGRTSLGLDCSALVQLSLMAAGKGAPRDTDLQEAMLGTAVEGGVACAAQARRPRLLARPRRHHDRRRIHDPRQRPRDGSGDRAARARRRADGGDRRAGDQRAAGSHVRRGCGAGVAIPVARQGWLQSDRHLHRYGNSIAFRISSSFVVVFQFRMVMDL